MPSDTDSVFSPIRKDVAALMDARFRALRAANVGSGFICILDLRSDRSACRRGRIIAGACLLTLLIASHAMRSPMDPAMADPSSMPAEQPADDILPTPPL